MHATSAGQHALCPTPGTLAESNWAKAQSVSNPTVGVVKLFVSLWAKMKSVLGKLKEITLAFMSCWLDLPATGFPLLAARRCAICALLGGPDFCVLAGGFIICKPRTP